MQTLLDRSDKWLLQDRLEGETEGYKTAKEWKAYNGREKGLLRFIAQDFLPEEIIYRKKSPYPKTHNPTYLSKIKQMLSHIMKDKNVPINNLLNRNYILEILNTDGKAFTRPWFGQLMVGPQLMAYICQVNMWLEKYKPKIEI